jgi:hypothetical protein
MEDLILVTGCTLVTSWGIAAFPDDSQDAVVSLRLHASEGGGAGFDWREVRPGVACQNSYQGPVRPFVLIAASSADPSFNASKGRSTSKSMRIYQGIPGEAHVLRAIDQPRGCRGTSPGRSRYQARQRKAIDGASPKCEWPSCCDAMQDGT